MTNNRALVGGARRELALVVFVFFLGIAALPGAKGDVWMTWSAWSQTCSQVNSCGVRGAQARTRICSRITGGDLVDNSPCVGPNNETRLCDVGRNCTGNWSAWSDWTVCTNVCNLGEQKRFRTCDPTVSGHTAIECMDDGSGFVETRPCTLPATISPVRAAFTVLQLPGSLFEGGVGVLICCVTPVSASSSVRLLADAQRLQNRTDLIVVMSQGRTEATFTNLSMSDGRSYTCTSDETSIDTATLNVVVAPRPTTQPMTTTPTTTPTTAPSTTSMSPGTTTKTTGGSGGPTVDSKDPEKDSSTLWIAVFVPVGLVLIIGLTILAAVLWHRRGTGQVIVARRDISGLYDSQRGDNVQHISVVKTKRTTPKRIGKDDKRRMSGTPSDV